ncbi:MAG: PEP-CTERM sorting domain-containing protein [Bacillota bacterium]
MLVDTARFYLSQRVCAILAGVTVMATVAPWANAKLILETRFAERTGQGEAQVGEVFNYDVYAVVTGVNDNLSDEALQSIHGRFVSKDINGGILRGTLAASPLAPYNDPPSTGGQSQDLDGDGDLDLGGMDPASPSGYFVARVSPIKGIPYSNGTPQEFKFAALTFTVTEVLAAQVNADTLIQFEQRPAYSAGLWIVDGELRSWCLEQGQTQGSGFMLAAAEAGPVADPEGFFFPAASLAAAVPEPAGMSMLALGALGLLWRRGRA